MHSIRFLLPLLLLNSALAQLVSPSAGQLGSYLLLFDSLVPGTGQFAPTTGCPDSATISDASRFWGGWHPNQGPCALPGPLSGSGNPPLPVEIVFLGATGTAWTSFGYTVDGAEHLLAGSVPDCLFGDHLHTQLGLNSVLDFYIGTTAGDRLQVFDSTSFGPSFPQYNVFWGVLVPDELPVAPDCPPTIIDGIPYTVIAFEASSPESDEAPPSYFAFAFRAGYDLPTPPIPEPATYGLWAAALLGLLAWKRRRR